MRVGPMHDGSRHQFPTRADFPVGGIVFQLEREKFQRKRFEILEGRVPRVPILN